MADKDEWERLEPAYEQLMQHARDAGFYGFGGNCAADAIAINDVLFDGAATYVAALNVFFFEKMNHAVGHIVLQTCDGRPLLDADGRFKGDDDVKSWGMLDSSDPDWEAQVEAQDLEIDDEGYDTAGIYILDDEADLRENIKFEYLNVNTLKSILQKTLERKSPEDRVMLSRLRELIQPLQKEEVKT